MLIKSCGVGWGRQTGHSMRQTTVGTQVWLCHKAHPPTDWDFHLLVLLWGFIQVGLSPLRGICPIIAQPDFAAGPPRNDTSQALKLCFLTLLSLVIVHEKILWRKGRPVSIKGMKQVLLQPSSEVRLPGRCVRPGGADGNCKHCLNILLSSGLGGGLWRNW